MSRVHYVAVEGTCLMQRVIVNGMYELAVKGDAEEMALKKFHYTNRHKNMYPNLILHMYTVTLYTSY